MVKKPARSARRNRIRRIRSWGEGGDRGWRRMGVCFGARRWSRLSRLLHTVANDFVELLEATLRIEEELGDVLAHRRVVVLREGAFVLLRRVVAVHVGNDVDDDFERRLTLEVGVFDRRHEVTERDGEHLVRVDLALADL